jgi:hypothetical protein
MDKHMKDIHGKPITLGSTVRYAGRNWIIRKILPIGAYALLDGPVVLYTDVNND